MRQTRGHLWLNTAEHGVSERNFEAVFGGLIRASYSHISVCAKHLNMWEARSIYLSLHFNCVSPENPGAQTAPETLAGGQAKHNSNVWAGETQSLPRVLGLHLFLLPAQSRSFPYGLNQTIRSAHDDKTRGSKKRKKR